MRTVDGTRPDAASPRLRMVNARFAAVVVDPTSPGHGYTLWRCEVGYVLEGAAPAFSWQTRMVHSYRTATGTELDRFLRRQFLIEGSQLFVAADALGATTDHVIVQGIVYVASRRKPTTLVQNLATGEVYDRDFEP